MADSPATRPGPPELFVDRSLDTGLDFVQFNGMSGELYLQEITCGGGALADLDNDGDLDAYLLQGHMVGDHDLDQALVPPKHPTPLTDRLYRNDLEPGGSLRFTDVSEALGEAGSGYGCGVAAGDVDNDGWTDLYVMNVGPNRLLRNLGPGTDGGFRFADVTAAAAVGDEGTGVTAVLFDPDRDGDLDLFVGNNVAFDNSGRTVCRSLSGAPDYCGPGAYPSQADRFYRNLGNGRYDGPRDDGPRDDGPRFEDAAEASGIASAPPRPTLGAVAADFDGDGWQDLYVANDGEPNNLWRNLGGSGFSDEAMLAGCAVNADGAAEASMGVAAGDFDSDGDVDLLLTHLIKETNTLYRNDGYGNFDDVTSSAGLGAASLSYTSFGTGFFDYDNDGWLDLLVVSGAVTILPELAAAGDLFPLHQRNQLFRNLGGAGHPGGGAVRFEEVTELAGAAFELSEVGRGAAFGDVDNDGDVDVMVVNNGGPVRLLVNREGEKRQWIGVRLVGAGNPGRDMAGARAAVLRAGEPVLWRRASTDGSYSSAGDPRIVFGLGDDPGSGLPGSGLPAVDGVRVEWPDGREAGPRVEDFAGLEAGRYHTLRQGEGRAGGGDG